MDVYKFIFSDHDQRITYQKDANLKLKTAEKQRLSAVALVKNAVPPKLRRQVDLKKLFTFTSDRGKALKSFLGKLSVSEERAFARAWEKYRLAESEMFKAQWQQRVWKSATYAEICSALGKYSQVDKDLTKIADEYRGYRNTGWAGAKQVQEVRKASRHVLTMPTKDLKVKKVVQGKKSKAASKKPGRSVDRAENVGGIDLTVQEGMVDVKGYAGIFDFLQTPEQLGAVKGAVDGFTPVVVNTQAVSDVGQFLGFAGVPLK
jgi:hypothetical protein